MKKLGFNMKALKKVFEAHGVNTSQPLGDREARIKADNQRFTQMLREQQTKELETHSLYPNGHPISFSFTDWKPALQHDEQQARAIGTKCFRLAKRFDKPFELFMTGAPGVGKTSLALAMLDTAKQQGRSILFISTIVLRGMYLQMYKDEVIKQRLWSVVGAMKKADVLVLDDFGTEGGSVSKVEQDGYTGAHQDMQRDMYDIANARWDAEHNQPAKTTIITSNNITEDLVKIYDPKTISRLISTDPKYTIAFIKMNDVRGVEV